MDVENKVIGEKEAKLKELKGKTAVIGYGSQGHAHAQNLDDSGLDIVVGVRKNGESWKKAKEDNMDVKPIPEAIKEAKHVSLLIPDEVQPNVYEEKIEPNLNKVETLVFAHGFNVHYNQINPPKDIDVIMVAPKGPGNLVRRMYERGEGTPALFAVYQDDTNKGKDKALAYAKGLGCTRAGVIETTFKEETESDLFGEQVDLCGGVTELVKKTFETLVDNGYQPEVAYFESLHELKLIVDLIHESGLSGMWNSVSNTAEYGGLSRRERIIDEATKKEMEEILEEIQKGEFAKEWILENKANRPSLEKLRKREENHLIEKVGTKLRKMMPWL